MTKPSLSELWLAIFIWPIFILRWLFKYCLCSLTVDSSASHRLQEAEQLSKTGTSCQFAVTGWCAVITWALILCTHWLVTESCEDTLKPSGWTTYIPPASPRWKKNAPGRIQQYFQWSLLGITHSSIAQPSMQTAPHWPTLPLFAIQHPNCTWPDNLRARYAKVFAHTEGTAVAASAPRAANHGQVRDNQILLSPTGTSPAPSQMIQAQWHYLSTWISEPKLLSMPILVLLDLLTICSGHFPLNTYTWSRYQPQRLQAQTLVFTYQHSCFKQ